jgi:hypothetical protein
MDYSLLIVFFKRS